MFQAIHRQKEINMVHSLADSTIEQIRSILANDYIGSDDKESLDSDSGNEGDES
jgi:hypothetical protein